MKSNIDKAINLLQLYRMEQNPEYLVMAHREFKKEIQDIKKLSLSKGLSQKSNERSVEAGNR